MLRGLIAGIAVVAPFAAASGETSRPVVEYEYAAKVVCGVQNDPGDARLAAGIYASALNIRNPHTVNIVFEKSLALTYPPPEQVAGAVHPIAVDEVGPGEALAVDCEDLRAEVFPYGFPAAYFKGFIVLRSPQELDAVMVTTAGGLDAEGGADELGSIDVEPVDGRPIPVVLEPPASIPPVGPDVSREDVLCSVLSQTSAIVEGTIDRATYTFDEAPGEGPRQVLRLIDVDVLAGDGAVLEQPIDLLQFGGYLPDGDFIFASHMPVLTVGERYTLFLRNTFWKLSPVVLGNAYRHAVVQSKSVLVDQAGYVATNIFKGRLPERVFEPEQPEETPSAIVDDPEDIASALTPAEYAERLVAFSLDCQDPVLTGRFAPYPTVPWDVTTGAPPGPIIQSP